MVSMFYPSGLKNDCEAQMVPYMPPATAALQDNYFSVSVEQLNMQGQKLTIESRHLDFQTGHSKVFNCHFAIKLLDGQNRFKISLS